MACLSKKDWTLFLADEKIPDALQDHLASCPKCRKKAQEFDATLHLLQNQKIAGLPGTDFEALHAAVLSRLDGLNKEPRRRVFSLPSFLIPSPRLGWVLAALLLVASLSIWGIMRRQNQYRPLDETVLIEMISLDPARTPEYFMAGLSQEEIAGIFEEENGGIKGLEQYLEWQSGFEENVEELMNPSNGGLL